MYEILMGKPPLCGRTAFLTMNQHLTTLPSSFSHVRPDLTVPVELERAVFKALAKKRTERFETVTLLQDELMNVQRKFDARQLQPHRQVEPPSVDKEPLYSGPERAHGASALMELTPSIHVEPQGQPLPEPPRATYHVKPRTKPKPQSKATPDSEAPKPKLVSDSVATAIIWACLLFALYVMLFLAARAHF